jgi:hypothetical protein
MTPDWLTMLATTGSAALVNAASTDAWQSARTRFSRLFGRGDAGRTETAARRLDALRGVAQEPDNDAGLAEARHTWRLRLQDLLEEHPEAADELRTAIAELPPPRFAPAVSYRQDNRAFGHGTVNASQGNLSIHQTHPNPG